MINSPLQNTWIEGDKQSRNREIVSQGFGLNPQIYNQFNMIGHNGIDFATPVGTPIFAPCDGWIIVKNDPSGYGLHIKLRSYHSPKEIVLGHFSQVNFPMGEYYKVNLGDYLGCTGNTGFSTGPHLHFGMRYLYESSNSNIFTWSVKNYNNGYYGYINPAYDKNNKKDVYVDGSGDYMITFKGTLIKNNL